MRRGAQWLVLRDDGATTAADYAAEAACAGAARRAVGGGAFMVGRRRVCGVPLLPCVSRIHSPRLPARVSLHTI